LTEQFKKGLDKFLDPNSYTKGIDTVTSWSSYEPAFNAIVVDPIKQDIETLTNDQFTTEDITAGLSIFMNFLFFGRAKNVEETAGAVKKVNEVSAKRKVDPLPNHSVIKGNKLPMEGKPNSSMDRVDDSGNLIQRRYYDENGRPVRDVDFTDHGNPKQHTEVPHEHIWDWSDPNKPKRP
jgi:hypothetical protein